MLSLTPIAASAEAPAAGGSVSPLPAWWSAPGRPGWTPDAVQSGGLPWTFAGLTAGAWRLDDPFAPVASHFGGLPEAQAPIAWYDTVRVTVGEGAAWTGFGAGVVTAEAGMRPPTTLQPRAVFTLANGDGGVERNGILLSRGNERSWLRVGTVTGRRRGIADMGPGAEHLWGFDTGTRRGGHAFAVRFAQRGLGESQRSSEASLGESGRGANGSLAWEWKRGPWAQGASIARAYDLRTSFVLDGGSTFSVRDAWTNSAEYTVSRAAGERAVDGRVTWSESRARRSTIFVPAFSDRQRTVWGAVRVRSPLFGGRAEVALGGGRDGAMAESRERWQLAPAASWRRGERVRWRVYGERALTPVWTDLDAGSGQHSFMQDAWLGGLEAEGGRGGRHWGALVVAGSVGGRALAARYPVRDIAMRIGWLADPNRYGFVLAQADGAWNWRQLGADARGWALVRDESTAQPNVDPAIGGSAGTTAAFKLFSGDMAIQLRADASWVGARWSEALVPGFEDRELPGYATFGAGAQIGVGDVTMLLRLDGLENERRPLSWLDQGASPDLVLARDSGRRFRFEMTWPLLN
ncbi:MAG: hypothetical protein HZA61_09045 [Candidatus Eisenbacteria bacterium]|uniref:Uncharacterized protein n=1 Tax=Eiseniibacteriota bacterium TaxID=2212470 RepID=A0A933SDC3_UNCEI|nr:hypothetical protein [Candidatus Eisenbacteria bacterium]